MAEKGWRRFTCRSEVAARAVAEQVKRLREWRVSGSLSGLPLAAVGRKVVVEVERRSRVSVVRHESWALCRTAQTKHANSGDGQNPV